MRKSPDPPFHVLVILITSSAADGSGLVYETGFPYYDVADPRIKRSVGFTISLTFTAAIGFVRDQSYVNNRTNLPRD